MGITFLFPEATSIKVDRKLVFIPIEGHFKQVFELSKLEALTGYGY